MDVIILAVGRMRAGPESELCSLYLNRARNVGRQLGFRQFDVHELAESRASRVQERKASEGKEYVALLRPGASLICLDATGELLDSDAFAAGLRPSGTKGPLSFVIGGPDGLDDAVLGRADRRISFGRLTWPHQIARVLLAEQLYRAMTILSGHPYHRA